MNNKEKIRQLKAEIERLKTEIERLEAEEACEFKKGELVEVRDGDKEPWTSPVYFIARSADGFKAAGRKDSQDLRFWEQCRKHIPDNQFWVDVVDGQRPKYEGLAIWDNSNGLDEKITRRTCELLWPWTDLKRFLPLDMAEYKKSIGRES